MVKERFKEFIQGYKDDEGNPIYWNMTKKMIERDEISLQVDFNDLEVWDPTISEKILDQPDATFKKLETVLKAITEKEEPGYVDRHEERLYVRIYNLPKRSRRDVRKIRAEHIGRMVTFDAVVTKTTEIKPLLTVARFKCVQCGMEIPRLQDEGRYNPPVRCTNDQCNKAGPFKLITTSCKFMDFQRLIVQERPEDLPAGHMPESFICYLFDDLVDLVRPGDRVTAAGTLRISGGFSMQRGRFAAFGKYMECNSIIKESEDYMNVEITDEDEEAIQEFAKDKFVHRKFWGSIAPAIHGNDMIKKAISLMLLGGTYKELEDKTKFRGEPNILLIGDPGVGKSKILKYIADLAPRGIYTSGKGTSAAGLCVSGESQVFLSNNHLPISQIVEKEFEKGDIQRYNDQIEYRKNTNDDLSVFHSSNLKLSTHQVSRVWRIESPKKLIKITSRTGRELKLTAETGMLSIERDVGLVWKPAKFIQPGNRVATASHEKHLCQITKNTYRNLDNVPGAYYILKEIVDFYGYTSRELVGSKAAFSPCNIKNRNISRDRLSMILKKIENLNWYNYRLKLKDEVRNRFYQEIRGILSQKSIIKISNQSKEQLYEYFIRKGRNTKIPVGIIISLYENVKIKLEPESRDYWSDLIKKVRKKHKECQKKYDLLKSLCDSDIFWDEITSVEVVESKGNYVYDLTIPETHNFIVNGFVVHNTAAVIRDQETKELALEAGALVLADRGVAIIDEFDKMDANDRAGLHEAMEAHTVSIAKAGIVATLNARCSILAAANPKLGRWDPDKDLTYNLNLPPAIISRFDLIFPLVDEPDEKEDRERAMFILSQHQKSALAEEPPADALFIRKFIAFARQTCRPKLTDEAVQRILEFYLKLRKQSTELDPTSGRPKSIAITPRQLEAIIRLSEAHAKVALRDKVIYEDAEAAIKLMEETLKMVATDPLTGKPDIDRVTSGRSSTTRSRLKIVNDIIEELTKDGDAASIKEIIRRSTERDLKKDDVEDIIQDLVRDGVYYEPSPGKVKRIS